MLKLFKKKFGKSSVEDMANTKAAKVKVKIPEVSQIQEKESQQYIPSIIMHSWGGSKEITQSLASLPLAEVYFSYC